MLSNLIVSSQKFVLIKDELGHDRISHQFITQILKEQGEDDNIKTLSLNDLLSDPFKVQMFLCECNARPDEAENKCWNVILPNLSDFLTYQKLSNIFLFLSKLKKCEYVKRIFLWVSIPLIQHDRPQYVVAALEYMADLVLHILSSNELSLLICKQGGGVTFKHYNYTRTNTEIKVHLKRNTEISNDSNTTTNTDDKKEARSTEQPGTFKIELDEEEMQTRNATKLPFEKGTEATESNIEYTPDVEDDFDQEDPDEDLNV